MNAVSTTPDTAAPGPKTAEGKRIAARNATTHGLFARDVVLTHLGESAEGYEALLVELAAQLHPTNLLERHYVEKIAAASWRLRRLHRWQAQLFEDPALTEDEALARLDRVMRHETALHRQIDTAVKMLGRDVPHLFESRARRRAQAELHVTEADCRRNAFTDWNVMERARRALEPRPLPPQMHERPEMLDNVPGSAPAPPQGHQQEECPNEPASSPTSPELGGGGPPSSPVSGEVARLAEPEGVLQGTRRPPAAFLGIINSHERHQPARHP